MRVLQVIDILAPAGGAQRALYLTVDLLQRSGHELAVLHADDAALDLGIPATRYTDSRLASRIAAFAPDVVHLHGPALDPALEPLLAGRAVVHSLHNPSFACASGMKSFRHGVACTRPHGPGCFVGAAVRGCLHRRDPRPMLARYRRIERELPRLREAAAVIVHSRFMRSVALQNGLPAERVELVPLFVVPDGDPPPPPSGRTVAFAGRISREKGVDLLIEALAGRPDAWDRLLVAGAGYDAGRCADLAARRGIVDRVEFLGHLDAAGVRRMLGEARVVAVPSQWAEPFGIVGLEAMASSRPVVGTSVGGIPEWLADGETGILVPPADVDALGAALASLLADADRAAALGAEGRRRVEQFSPQAHAEKLLSVYERAAATAVARGSAEAA